MGAHVPWLAMDICNVCGRVQCPSLPLIYKTYVYSSIGRASASKPEC